MLRVVEQICYAAGYERSSVWAFTRAGVPKYCSVTVPTYLGLGASGSTYLHDIFYLNTFNVRAYIRSLERGRLPIALSLPLTRQMQMAGWLYWRLYEARFNKDDFRRRFHEEFDDVCGTYMRPLRAIGFIQEQGQAVRLTDPGAYWLHVSDTAARIAPGRRPSPAKALAIRLVASLSPPSRLSNGRCA